VRAFAIALVLAACHPSAPSPRFPDPASLADDVTLEIVAGPTIHGRDAVARALGDHVIVGRQWIDGDTRVVELVLGGVAAAVIIRTDARGEATRVRLYADKTARAPITAPIAGTAVIEHRGTSIEQANLAAATKIWAALDAHDPDGVLTGALPTYVYDDRGGPAPLDTKGTRALLDRFLHLVDGFTIVEKPVFFAAGDDVITESVEHMTFHGKPITLHGLDIKHFTGGALASDTQYANSDEARAAITPAE